MNSWQQHAALLDAQPSNRRLVQEARTPRELRDAGIPEWPWDQNRFDDWMFGVCCGAVPWLVALLAERIWG